MYKTWPIPAATYHGLFHAMEQSKRQLLHLPRQPYFKSNNYKLSSVWMIDRMYVKQFKPGLLMSQWPKGSLLVEHFWAKERYHRGNRAGCGRFPKMLWEWQGGPLQHKHSVCQSKWTSEDRKRKLEEKLSDHLRYIRWTSCDKCIKKGFGESVWLANKALAVHLRVSVLINNYFQFLLSHYRTNHWPLLYGWLKCSHVSHLGRKPLLSKADKEQRVNTHKVWEINTIIQVHQEGIEEVDSWTKSHQILNNIESALGKIRNSKDRLRVDGSLIIGM